MGLRRTVDTLTPLASNIWSRASGEAKQILRQLFQKIGKNLRDEAKKRAPVKSGALERSIVYETRMDAGELRLDVYVRTSTLNAKDKEAFLEFIHDGDYDLGPGSKAKQAGQAEEVGPEFMDRALDDHIDGIQEIIEEEIIKRFE